MKKLLFTLFTIGLLFSSCGGDDTPPTPEPDYTLYDKSEIMGVQTGEVVISLSTSTVEPFKKGAKTNFITHTDNTALNLFFLSPVEELGGPFKAFNFKKSPDGKNYTFSIETNPEILKTDAEIPSYIKNWFGGTYVLTKIKIKNLACSDAKYDKGSKKISMTFKGALELYAIDNDTKLEKKVGDDNITFAFTNLVK